MKKIESYIDKFKKLTEQFKKIKPMKVEEEKKVGFEHLHIDNDSSVLDDYAIIKKEEIKFVERNENEEISR